MPVEVTKPLSPGLQYVADCRTTVTKCEVEVKRLKGELKTAKSLLETANEDLAKAVDELLEAERQPSLFDGINETVTVTVGDGPAADDADGGAGKPGPRVVNAEPGDGSTAFNEVVFDGLALSGPPAILPEPAALPAAPAWRALACPEHLDGPLEMFDALDRAGVATLGELADRLLAGETFGLKPVADPMRANHLLDLVADLRDAVEQVSADDPNPIRFPRTEGEGQEVEVGADAVPRRQQLGKRQARAKGKAAKAGSAAGKGA